MQPIALIQGTEHVNEKGNKKSLARDVSRLRLNACAHILTHTCDRRVRVCMCVRVRDCDNQHACRDR